MPTRIEEALNSLLTGSRGEINSKIEQVSFNYKINDTQSKGYCYCLKVDANNNLRLKDLIEFIDRKLLDYAIPKKEIDEAKAHMNETGSTSEIFKLRHKAKGLFTDLEKTGEGGEILLYILVEEFLKLPQLISKMSLKTSGKLHYQGADGIHVKFDESSGNLELYWGESKMYADISAGISNCMDSIKGFLTDVQSASSVQERDVQLITGNITANVNNPDLEDAIVAYLDKDNDLSNKLLYKGICFIGFDYDKYPKGDIVKTTEQIKLEIEQLVEQWYAIIKNKIESVELHLKELHIFLMPFPSVAEFRQHYLETID